MIYGYARCSTSEDRQDIGRENREFRAMGVEKDADIYSEGYCLVSTSQIFRKKIEHLCSSFNRICYT